MTSKNWIFFSALLAISERNYHSLLDPPLNGSVMILSCCWLEPTVSDQCLISVPNFGTIYPMILKQPHILQILSACCKRGQGRILTTLSALMYELYSYPLQIISLYASNIESRFYIFYVPAYMFITVYIDLLPGSHSALVPYPMVCHFVTEMCTCAHLGCGRVLSGVFVWCSVGFVNWVYCLEPIALCVSATAVNS